MHFWILILLIEILLSECRIHHLPLQLDDRTFIPLSTFGFIKDGTLEVYVSNFTIKDTADNVDSLIGFTLDRTFSDTTSSYLDSRIGPACSLDDRFLDQEKEGVVHIVMDFESKRLNSTCSQLLRNLEVSEAIPKTFKRDTKSPLSRRLEDSTLVGANSEKKGGSAGPGFVTRHLRRRDTDSLASCKTSIEMKEFEKQYSFQFIVRIPTKFEQGLYNLNFHHCVTDKSSVPPVSLTVEIVEMNGDNYLSAGEMPLPKLYFCASIFYFLAFAVWISCLAKSSKQEVYKIHYLMALLVFLKAVSLALHGLNYTFIRRDGYHIEAWAVLYYVTHLLKGAVLFITIILIGTGWAFVKHILSERDKKLFMLVIPVQILANVAYIITEESEQGNVGHMTWSEMFILLDLVCCGAILFPVVWSIRHLQEASQTDGKAAMNLEKLKLFRHFYIMVVCYIYFTRIIVYLLKITVPFQYTWLDELFFEVATFTFFVFTGYIFRPALNNPYFLMAEDDEEECFNLEEVLTTTGLTENVTRLSRNKTNKDGGRYEETQSLVQNSEDSHEFD
ncbi:protein GPR107-like [Artemia franciscana]|uniref:GOST seven transmembrane domain-containing protein n=1 Tax=Artemia franciscana TaxID=6661 RepID=A0AA88I1P6_ARTSF|nr:hypothetical protein QYM36_005006 [Artemia franciscana]